MLVRLSSRPRTRFTIHLVAFVFSTVTTFALGCDRSKAGPESIPVEGRSSAAVGQHDQAEAVQLSTPTAEPDATGEQTDARVLELSALPLGLRTSVQRMVQASALSGSYRWSANPSAIFGESIGAGWKQVNEGTFAYAAPDRFRVTGLQKLEIPDEFAPPEGEDDSAEIDILFDRRRVITTNLASGRIPRVPVVTMYGPKLFASDPFRPQGMVNSSPFYGGDIAGSIVRLSLAVQFDPPEGPDENGITRYTGTRDLAKYVDLLIESRDLSLVSLIQPTLSDEMVDALLETMISSLRLGRYVAIYIDQDGWIRGWDVGLSAGGQEVSMRLDDLKTSTDVDAFTLEPDKRDLATDATNAIAAQTEALLAAYDNKTRVAVIKARIVERLERQDE